MSNPSITPTGWKKINFRNVRLSLQNGGTPDTGNMNYWSGSTPWITGADFDTWGISEFRRYVSITAINTTSTNVVPAGNLLIVTRTGVGKIAIAPCDIAISQDITGVQINPKDTNINFFYYCMKKGVDELKKLNQGTSINGIVRRDLENYELLLPPIYEQDKIGEILTTIDLTIRNTEFLIAKYQQIKAGMMHDLFTRGVDAHGRLRPPREHAPGLYKKSPIGWIPKEWDTKKLCKITQPSSPICYGIVQPGTHVHDGIAVVAIYNLNSNFENVHRSRRDIESQYVRSRILPRDVLLSIKGTIGRVDLVPNNFIGNISRDVARIRPVEEVDSTYLRYHLESNFMQAALQRIVVGTTRMELSIGRLKLLDVIIPPLDEQKHISEKLSEADDLLKTEEDYRYKCLMQKAGLMNDLLTGRVRVEVTESASKEAAS